MEISFYGSERLENELLLSGMKKSNEIVLERWNGQPTMREYIHQKDQLRYYGVQIAMHPFHYLHAGHKSFGGVKTRHA